jgi:hypothetical protein
VASVDTNRALEDLAEEAMALEVLLAETDWADYAGRVQDEIERFTARIMSGRLDHDEYTRLTGFVQGMRHALTLPAKVQAMYERIRLQDVALQDEQEDEPE